ncbi:MAG: c-type cytochrome [Psychrobacter sp.]
MSSITKILGKARHVITGSMAVLLLSGAMLTNASAADTATTYDNSCAVCHDSGALNAIKKGNSAEWQQLIDQKGMASLIQSVKSGMPQMPAGGLCKDCNDDDYRKLIEYMID